MIEDMIVNIKERLPLKISEAKWDGTVFQIYSAIWSFTTLSAWRISTNNKMIFGCFDKNSMQLISSLEDDEIIDIGFQSDLLKIDPVFTLSSARKIEVFSTDTFEPWTFQIDGLGVFIPTPSEPNAFSSNNTH